MRRYLVYIIFILILFSCNTTKVIEREITTIDTIYQNKNIYIDVPIPYEIVKHTITKDSISELETSLAKSIASINNGKLYHLLEHKSTKLKADTIINDTTIYKEIIKHTIEIEEKEYVPFWIYLIGGIMISLFIILYIKK